MRYQIQGETLPVVICELEGGEKMITEGGGMAWMSPNMLMETTTNGGIGKAFGRMFSGEHMFQNIYTAQGGPGMIAFASSFPGSVRAFQIAPGQEMILQKSAFLAEEMGIELSRVFFVIRSLDAVAPCSRAEGLYVCREGKRVMRDRVWVSTVV